MAPPARPRVEAALVQLAARLPPAGERAAEAMAAAAAGPSVLPTARLPAPAEVQGQTA